MPTTTRARISTADLLLPDGDGGDELVCAAAAAAAASAASPAGAAGPRSCCSSPAQHDARPQQQQQAAATAAAQLRGLQRTPLPLIIARMKVLLERLNMLRQEQQQAASSSCTPSAAAAFFCASGDRQPAQPYAGTSSTSSSQPAAAAAQYGWHPSSNAAAFSGSRPGSAANRRSAVGTPQGGSGSSHRRPCTSPAPAKTLTEVSTSGGLSQSVMQRSAESIQDELEVTLGFISEFLAGLSPDTRRALSSRARLESFKKDQVIYDIGDSPSHFFVVLSGRVELWSHPPGTHRPKSVVSVLRRGDAFGDQAIINGQSHGTAASPATNVTLLRVTRQDFVAVLGGHFGSLAAAWQQFLLKQVAPVADCDPATVRRLCSTLVSEKPAAGQECSVQEDKVCFVKAGMFELRLIDLAAQQAAEAALAAAMASASSALPIAPIPPHLCSKRPGSSSSSSSRRPASAPSGGRRPPGTAAVTAHADVSSSSSQPGPAAAGGAAGVAAGLQMLQGALAHLPMLGSEGVLASVRVRDGRLVGTQGLVMELRRQHSSCVPYKVIAELGPGSWFGGGPAILGAGPLQSALRVVAVGPAGASAAAGAGCCELLHTHLAGLEQHGGPELIKRLRDDAAFTLSYYLGRIGVLELGAAVGHPESALVAEAAAATEAVAAAAAAACAATGVSSGSIAAASPGRSPCNTFRSSRPASAAAAGSIKPGRPEGSSLCKSIAAGAAGVSSSSSRPASALQQRDGGAARGAGRGAAALRRSSSSCSSSSSGVSSSSTLDSTDGLQPPAAAVEAAVAAAGAEGVGVALTADACHAASGFAAFPTRSTSRPHQKRAAQPHVPGSGVFGPGVMAALQHVHALQATKCTAAAPGAAASAGAGAGGSSILDATSSSSGCGTLDAGSRRPQSALCGGSSGSSSSKRSGGTAADSYWMAPHNSSTATSTALSGLLSTLFTDGLQPLVSELDCLVSRSGAGQRNPKLMQQQPDVCPAQQQQQQCWQRPTQRRPASAGGRLQAAAGAPAGSEVLTHKPAASLLAASVMWQRGSAAAFRPPLRQCLTTAEIEQLRSGEAGALRAAGDGARDCYEDASWRQ